MRVFSVVLIALAGCTTLMSSGVRAAVAQTQWVRSWFGATAPTPGPSPPKKMAETLAGVLAPKTSRSSRIHAV